MKWLNRLAALFFGLITLGMVKDFFDKNRILVVSDDVEDLEFGDSGMDRSIADLRPENYDNAVDLRGQPTHVCICGCFVWNVKVMFSDNKIAQYFLDMECAQCGSLATAPTPTDHGTEL